MQNFFGEVCVNLRLLRKHAFAVPHRTNNLFVLDCTALLAIFMANIK